MSFDIFKYSPWLNNPDIRPYVLIRSENIPKIRLAAQLKWFEGLDIMELDALEVKNKQFADMILALESQAFKQSNMPMPGWVFFDCGIMPGLVVGFAMRKSALPSYVLENLPYEPEGEWIPISLFIAIPSMNKGEWIAHNLSSVNSVLERKDKFYGLGFLTKAFGLWYAGVENLCGMTQWGSPAVKLHSCYGPFEILTSYTPIHSYPATMTYKCEILPFLWERFFTKERYPSYDEYLTPSKIVVDPSEHDTLKSFQAQLELKKDRYYLNPNNIRSNELKDFVKLFFRTSTKNWHQ